MTNSAPRAVLIGESFSPWTQKARWALEYCGVAFDYAEYTPTISEPGLRWRMKQWSGVVSVPVLCVDRRWVRGSWEIARYASASAGDGRLGDLSEIAPWNEISEAALAEGRTRVVRSVMNDPQALEEALASILPRPMRRPMRFVARDAARRLDRKYAHLAKPGSLRLALERTREGLAKSGGDYLLGRFTYADVAMSVVLETIAPIARTAPPLGLATRRCWSDPALAEEFDDLLQWRQRLAAADATSYSQLRQLTTN
jgi:glutathione S-transferase